MTPFALKNVRKRKGNSEPNFLTEDATTKVADTFQPFQTPPKMLTYSGGNVTKMPIIGKVTTIPLKLKDADGNEKEIPSLEYSVVEIVETERGKVYVANFWYKEHKRIPQIIHESIVEKFKPE
jgi:hypothetical protein